MTFGRILDMDTFDMFDGKTETGLISELSEVFVCVKLTGSKLARRLTDMTSVKFREKSYNFEIKIVIVIFESPCSQEFSF